MLDVTDDDFFDDFEPRNLVATELFNAVMRARHPAWEPVSGYEELHAERAEAEALGLPAGLDEWLAIRVTVGRLACSGALHVEPRGPDLFADLDRVRRR